MILTICIVTTSLYAMFLIALCRKHQLTTFNEGRSLSNFFKLAFSLANRSRLFELSVKNKSEELAKDLIRRICFRGCLDTTAPTYIARMIELDAGLLKTQSAQTIATLVRSLAIFLSLAASLAIFKAASGGLGFNPLLVSTLLFIIYCTTIALVSERSNILLRLPIHVPFLKRREYRFTFHFIKYVYFLADVSRKKCPAIEANTYESDNRPSLIEDSLGEWLRIRKGQFHRYQDKISTADILILFPSLAILTVGLLSLE